MKKIILDCDPGCDDAIAILMALSAPQLFSVEGITTISGNASLEWIHKNARRICELAGRPDVKVYAGCPGPMLRAPVNAAFCHGDDGLGGVDLPEPQMPLQDQHAVDFLIDLFENTKEPLTLAPTGPLTNLAVVFIKRPDLASKIKEIIWMGGAIGAGNITPSSEFNAYVDPHALAVILETGIPFKMIGLDVTHQVATTPEWLEAAKALGTAVGDAAAAMLGMGAEGDIERYNLTGRAIHDACVIAYLMAPDLFSMVPASITVELSEGPHVGATTVSTYPKHVDASKQHYVATDVQKDKVLDLILSCLSTYGQQHTQPHQAKA